MSVVNGQIANQTTFNNAFMSRTAITTQTVAAVALENVGVGSGAFINNVQKAINKAFEGVGASGENDAAINTYANNHFIFPGNSRKTAIEKLDAQLYLTQTDLDADEVVIAQHGVRLNSAEATIISHTGTLANHETRIGHIENDTMTIGGNKTFSGNMIVQGNFEVQGTTSTINSATVEVTDQNILVNKGGTNGSAEGAGLDVERPSGNAGIRFDSTLASKFKIGLVSALYEIVVSGIAQTIVGIKDFSSGIKTNTVVESTLNSGVTVASVLIKAGKVDGRTVSTDGSTLDSHVANISNPHSTTKAQIGLTNVTDDAQLKRAAGDINSFTEKLVPVAGDYLLIEDSAAAFVKKKIQIANLPSTAPVASGAPIGSIQDSMLTLAQFQSLMGTGWVLANGGSAIGSAYATLTGFTTVPDLRGVARRGKNNGRVDGNQNPDGDLALGTFQSHATAKNGLALSDPGHAHPVTVWFSEVGVGPNQPNIQGYGGTGPFTNASTTAANTTGISLGAGDNETRMRNVTVNVFIRIN